MKHVPMTYELAKKLKEAGFCQNSRFDGLYFVYDLIMTRRQILEFRTMDGFAPDIKNFVYIPTLEELIEACGEEFHCLVHTTNGGMDCDKDFWSAGTSPNVFEWSNGKTPSEAVANLWLALNNK